MRKLLAALAAVTAVLLLTLPTLDAQQTIVRADQYVFGTGGINASRRVLTGAGSPESVITAPIGAIYLRTDGGDGTTLYIKSTGAGNTGWTAAATSPGSAASSAASFITKVAEAGLSNEFALGSLATALLINTTTTGVPTAYAGTLCTNQFPRSLSAVGAATCASVSLTLDVTGDLPFANLTQIAGLSVLGVTGNALADVAAITAGSDFQVLRRSGTSLIFGAVDLSQSAAVVNQLATANGGTGQNSTATFPTSGVVTTDVNAMTFTNKTYDAEGAGNVLTIPFRTIFRAAYCQNVTPLTEWSLPTADAATVSCNTGTNTQKGTLDFPDGATTTSAQNVLWLPSDFTGTIAARIRWFTPAIAGDVVWQLATICVADGETSDPAFNAASTVTDTAKGTTLQDNDAAIATVTITGCAAGEMLYLRFFRDPTNGGDTLADTASLRALELTIRRAM